MNARAMQSRIEAAEPRASLGVGPSLVRADAPDPFARVMSLGDRAVKVGLAIGLAIGLMGHGAAAERAITSLGDLLRASKSLRAELHEFFWRTYDIETIPKPVAKEEPPPPPPEPLPQEPVAKPPTPAKMADPYDPPPAPAKAGKVLTQEPKANEKIEDMTNTIVSGDGAGTHGLVSAQGVGDKPVERGAILGGQPGGTGTGAIAAAPPPPGPDLSKAPGLVGGGNWHCPFPPEADGDSIDRADVVIRVTVRPDGSPTSVAVVNDPGHGFGRAARACALGRRYSPALDRSGAAITQTTPNITVHFTR